MSYYPYPKYVPVAEKRAKAEKKLKQLKKKNPSINPVIITGKAIANTWWGKEWNKNLEKYADFSNRIGRGRSYVRHGAVLDMKIEPGRVTALVQGSTSRPYEITIDIKKIPNSNWSEIKQACKGNMDNVQNLMAGKFPKKLADIFTSKGNGLFPSPDEIKFSCSCPDYAYMCKHVAAALYGIGARLDTDPGLFFILRKANMNDLIFETIRESKQEILSKAGRKTSRVIEDQESLSELFGIDLGENPDKPKIKKKSETTKKTISAKYSTASDKQKIVSEKQKQEAGELSREAGKERLEKRKTSIAISVKISKTDKIKKRPFKEISKKPKPATEQNPTENRQLQNPDNQAVLQILKKSKKELSVADIIAKTSMTDQKVRNILYRLKVQGIIENSSRGMYRRRQQ